ncbi:MAG: LysE family translocator [Actinomycetota bacterium]
MPGLHAYLLFCLAAVALLVIPGPAVTYVVARSIHEGRRAGLASALGLATGTIVHVVGAAIGLSAVIASSATAFAALRFGGAAYLIFLGVRTLMRKEPIPTGAAATVGAARAYRQAVIVEILNPKTALFFLAFLPQFVDPSRGFVTVQTVVLGLSFIAIGLCTDSSWAMLASGIGQRFRERPGFARSQRLVTGGVLVALGTAAAVSGSRPSVRSA